ncbi:hypothetical protein TRFO_39690 [Tritrichomonas foetus]|uniref:Uncharacterized protein n=1 Tax=Tritrichomonas foetus TaxID=1144522 RepID=A0A1J4J7F2_9EUKA|nr:hypothetical protein TRFO_39690 [Tritrichomonas foetus]|eukprot:OHS94135.1 hypothetical protein TRFO_39690 [Tritrichomonas foetus]
MNAFAFVVWSAIKSSRSCLRSLNPSWTRTETISGLISSGLMRSAMFGIGRGFGKMKSLGIKSRKAECSLICSIVIRCLTSTHNIREIKSFIGSGKLFGILKSAVLILFRSFLKSSSSNGNLPCMLVIYLYIFNRSNVFMVLVFLIIFFPSL